MQNRQVITALQQKVALSDDQAAYEELFCIFYTPLLRFACSLVTSPEVAEEIVSDVFINIWERRKQLSEISHLTMYLYSSIRNASLNHLLKHKRESTCQLEEDQLQLGGGIDPEELYIAGELRKVIEQAVNMLPDKCRTIFKMVKEGGLKYREAAHVLGISVKTVEAQMGIAIKRINKAINDVYNVETLQGIK